MIEYELIAELPRESDYKNLPSEAGVYFIVKNSIIYYIGESDNIRNRIQQHKHTLKILNPEIFYYLVEDKDERKSLEKELILKHKPSLNSTVNENRDIYKHIPDLLERGYTINYRQNGESGYLKISLNN